MELRKIKIHYVDHKTGDSKYAYNYYLVVDGVSVAVKPVFKNDYRLLSILAVDGNDL